MKGLKEEEEVEGRGKLWPGWLLLLLFLFLLSLLVLRSEEEMREYLSVLSKSRSEGRGMCIREVLGIVLVGGVDDACLCDQEEAFFCFVLFLFGFVLRRGRERKREREKN